MKTCKIFSTRQNAETGSVIMERRVLVPMPRRKDAEPAYVDADGQCYYTPVMAVDFAAGLHFDLMPFSTECDWGEYGAAESNVYAVMENFYGFSVDTPEKWGYCDTNTGNIRIPPSMERCRDFNEYGAAIIECSDLCFLIDTNGSVMDWFAEAVFDIQESHHGVFFVETSCDGYTAVDSKGSSLIHTYYSGLEWDGVGGLTAINNWHATETVTYGIINPDYYDSLVGGLTCKPVHYDFPPEYRYRSESLDDYFKFERFRLIQRGDKYGLVRDVIVSSNDPYETYSELILNPEFEYGELPAAAYQEWEEREIRHYAKLMSKTPRKTPGRVGDGWNCVPKDIRTAVRAKMTVNGYDQPETADDIEEWVFII